VLGMGGTPGGAGSGRGPERGNREAGELSSTGKRGVAGVTCGQGILMINRHLNETCIDKHSYVFSKKTRYEKLLSVPLDYLDV